MPPPTSCWQLLSQQRLILIYSMDINGYTALVFRHHLLKIQASNVPYIPSIPQQKQKESSQTQHVSMFT